MFQKYNGWKEIPYSKVIPNNPNDLILCTINKGDKDKGFVVTERFTVPFGIKQ